MQYLDKLKKERPLDRVIFLVGMVLTFIGFLIPTIFVKQIVTKTDLTVAKPAESVGGAEMADDSVESADFEAEESDFGLESDAETEDSEFNDESDVLADAEESDGLDFDEYDDTEREFVHFASKKEIVTDYKKNLKKDVYGNYERDSNGNIKFDYILDKTGNKIIETTTAYKYVIVDAEITENDDGEKVFVLENGKPKLTYVLNFDKNGDPIPDDEFVRVTPEELEKNYTLSKNHFNLFGLVNVFNQAGVDYGDVDYIGGTAYNVTFLVIVWLCSIAGIVLFFLTKSIIGDVVVVLIAIAFGLASAFCIPLTLSVTPIIGYFSVGGYFVLIGILVSLAGTLLGAAHIKHPGQVVIAEEKIA